ncbi:MAG: trypsin-like serine protease [Bryobacteraceae bacterium]|jgi:secreted trypsin-like serine protease
MSILTYLLRGRLLLAAILSSAPAWAIVVAGTDPSSAIVTYGQSVNGVNLSGVVMVTSSIGGCSGTLLMDGWTILTAGHCVTSSYGSPIASNITVTFLGPSGTVSDTVSSVSVNPGYTGDSTQGDDLAVLKLHNAAPYFATGYPLFDGAPTTAPDVVAGYGVSGTGLTGANGSYGVLRAGENAYATTGEIFGWSSTLLIGEFYKSGAPSTNALWDSYGLDPNPYDAADEVDISHGDSGGPSFYDGELIGVHDLGICLSSQDSPDTCSVPPSLNTSDNSYFGELYGDVSVSANADWIEAQEVPEPVSAVLLAFGLCAIAWARRRPAGLFDVLRRY